MSSGVRSAPLRSRLPSSRTKEVCVRLDLSSKIGASNTLIDFKRSDGGALNRVNPLTSGGQPREINSNWVIPSQLGKLGAPYDMDFFHIWCAGRCQWEKKNLQIWARNSVSFSRSSYLKIKGGPRWKRVAVRTSLLRGPLLLN